MALGLTRAYRLFRKELITKKDKISVLQLTGKNEDYLVKEFVECIYRLSKGLLLPIVNVGKTQRRKERQYDIAVLKKDHSKETIISLIESKYLRNVHRFKTNEKNINEADDENDGAIRTLAEQLKFSSKSKTHGGYEINLRSLKNDVYALVFISYVSENKKRSNRDEFLEKQIGRAVKYNLINWDMDSRPRLKKVYSNVKVNFFENDSRYTSLYSGLWRLGKNLGFLSKS